MVGYSIDDTIEAAMVKEALKRAFRGRTVNDVLIIHSDQGAQHASNVFRGMLKAFNAIQSMSRKGDCRDNSVAESFFAAVKGELIDRQHWISKAHARLAIVERIECFYNNQRRYSSIGGVCPVEYESLTRAMHAA